MQTLEQQRAVFLEKSGKFLAFPLAGTIVWLAIGVTSLFLSQTTGIYTLLFGTGLIFPLALLIAKFTKQDVFQKGNDFGALMGSSVLMVNLLWALHLVLVTRLPNIAPLSIAIGLGIHWIVFGWIIQSSLGRIHAIIRTVLCTIAYVNFPEKSVFAVAIVVVFCYILTMFQLLAFFKKQEA